MAHSPAYFESPVFGRFKKFGRFTPVFLENLLLQSELILSVKAVFE